MSQFNIRSLREIHGDEQGKFLNTLAKRVSTFLNKEQTDKLENKEDIYSAGQDVESVVKFHDMVSTKYFDFETEFYPPSEPDADKVTLWLKGDNLGNTLNDISGFGNNGSINGDPLLIDGTPFDYGIHTGGTKSVALRFNRPTSELVNQEYITIPDHNEISPLGFATGFSIFMRFRVFSLASQGGLSRTLWEKVDDSTPNDGHLMKLSSAGRLIFVVIEGGVETKKQTGSSAITTDTVYDLWATYDKNTNAIKIYLNNVDQTLTDNTDAAGWHGTLSNHDMSIFRRGLGSSGGHIYGDLYDFMLKRQTVVSATDVSRHYTNKWTTADIPFGQVMVSDYYATYTP